MGDSAVDSRFVACVHAVSARHDNTQRLSTSTQLRLAGLSGHADRRDSRAAAAATSRGAHVIAYLPNIDDLLSPLVADTIKAQLVNNSYTPDVHDEFLSDVPSGAR